jgi:hypothetical protein
LQSDLLLAVCILGCVGCPLGCVMFCLSLYLLQKLT